MLSMAKHKAADYGGLSQKTSKTRLTAAAVFFALCRLVVAAFALIGLRGRLLGGHLSLMASEYFAAQGICVMVSR
jgi:hypothetical protein